MTADSRRSIRENPRWDRRQSAPAGKRGAALWIVLMTAVFCSIGVYAALVMASSGARRGRFYASRIAARYASEGGIVVVQQRLWNDPAYCPPGNIPPGGGTVTVPVGGVNAVVTMTNCGAGNTHQIKSKAAW